MQTERQISGKSLVLFCEECGRRNIYADTAEIEREGGYRCEFCQFLTPLYASSALRDRKEPEKQDQSSFICQPDNLVFDTISSRIGTTRRLAVVPGTDEGIAEVKVEPMPQLSDTVIVEQIDNQTFAVTVLPVTNPAEAMVEYHGPGVTVRDTRSGNVVEIDISFQRTGPTLKLEKTQINLGRIQAGMMLKDYFKVENIGDETLYLQIQPDPNYYSIAAQFTVDSSPSLSLEPAEIKKISFLIWPSADISTNWSYFQPIGLQTNELGINGKKNVVITCVVNKQN